MIYYVFIDENGMIYAVTPQNVTLTRLEIETDDVSKIEELVQQTLVLIE